MESVESNPNRQSYSNRRAKPQKTLYFASLYTILTVLCMVACAVVVTSSDGQPVDSWHVQPAVLLAIINSVLNLVFSAAFALGIAVIWWRCCYRGTKLSTLHHVWEHGATLNPFSALAGEATARKVLIISAIVAGLKFITNPLLQRATGVALQSVFSDETMEFAISQRVSDGHFGLVGNAERQEWVGSPNGIAAAQAWWHNSTIFTGRQPRQMCNHTCTGTVAGAGISVTCDPPTTSTLDILASISVNQTLAMNGTQVSDSDYPPIFQVVPTLFDDSDGIRTLRVVTLRSSAIDESCNSTLIRTVCKLKAAVVRYPIVITEDVVTLDTSQLNDMTVESTFSSAGDLSTAPHGSGLGILAGLQIFTKDYVGANTVVKPSTASGKPVFNGKGIMASMFYVTDMTEYPSENIWNRCRMMFRDPTEFVLHSAHNFLFRAAVAAGNSSSINQVFDAHRQSQTPVFKSNYQYLGGALGGMGVAMFAILILLWGWWELEWHVSLSPIELGRAFRSPVMAGAGKHPTVGDILYELGDTKVRFQRGSVEEVGGFVLQDEDELRLVPRKTPAVVVTEIRV